MTIDLFPTLDARLVQLLERKNPTGFAEYLACAEAERKAQEKEIYEGSLLEFFKRAWREIDTAPLVMNWHLEKVAEALEAVTFGEIRDLVINLPPRHGKSLLVSVVYPAWIWCRSERLPLSGPQVSFLCVSYAAKLAESNALKMLWLVQGDWYQSLWGDRVSIRADQSSRTDFGNMRGGERYSASIEGGLIGRGGDLQICFPYDELIWTESGPQTIGDIVEARAGIKVWSFNKRKREFELRPIIGWHRNPGRRLVKITTSRGAFRCTEDHRLIDWGGREICARDLCVGDLLLGAQCPRGHSDVANGGGANIEETSDCLTGSGGLGDGFDFDFGKIGSASSSVGVNDEIKMFPPTSSPDPLNGAVADVVSLRQHSGRFCASCDLSDHILSQMTGAITKATMALHVVDVLSPSTVGKAGELRLCAVTVDVPNFLPGRTGAEESASNEAMDFPVGRLPVQGKCDAGIAVNNSTGHHSCGHPPGAFAGGNASQRADTAEVGNLISRKAFDREPTFVRVLAVEIIHEIPTSTYCVSVEYNANFVAGQAYICVKNCDDPHSVAGAESDAEREATMRAFTESLPTRIRDPQTSARILIMQRLHEEDATGWAIANWNNPTHLMFPAHFDPARASEGDPRTEPGELIWPSLWTEEAYDRLKLGPYARSGQLEQRPEPRGGGIFKREWIEPWPPLEPDGSRLCDAWIKRNALGQLVIQYPQVDYVVGWVDMAFTDNRENDPCAMIVLGIWRSEGKGRIERRGDGTYVRVADTEGYPKVILLYGWEKWLTMHGPPDEPPPGIEAKEWNSPKFFEQRSEKWGAVEWVVHTCKKYKVDHLGIETQGGGLTLRDEIERLHRGHDFGVEVVPAKHDKVARAYAEVHIWSNRQFYVPQFMDGTFPTWCTPLVDQWATFPKSKSKGATDAMTGALAHLRQTGILDRREEWDGAEESLRDYERFKPVMLPYPL